MRWHMPRRRPYPRQASVQKPSTSPSSHIGLTEPFWEDARLYRSLELRGKQPVDFLLASLFLLTALLLLGSLKDLFFVLVLGDFLLFQKLFHPLKFVHQSLTLL